MTEEELRELFRDMQSKGLNPMLCDTEVPLYAAEVPCGDPTSCYSESTDSEWLPKELLSIHPEFMVRVKGDSMKDLGIVTGDVVRVMGDVTPQDGDIVLACIDGDYTLKTYCVDDDGLHWLVPHNDKYEPILLDERHNVRMYGRVIEIVKKAPRASFRTCMKLIRKAKEKIPSGLKGQDVELGVPDDLMAKLKPLFYNNEEDVRLFLKEVKGMQDKDITALVNKWVAEKRITDLGNSRKGDLWGILKEAGLYESSRQNWCRRVY